MRKNCQFPMKEECAGTAGRGRITQRNVTARVVGVDEGEVHYFARKFQELGAHVRYFGRGHVRVALADNRYAVLAFPLPCTGIHLHRRSALPEIFYRDG